MNYTIISARFGNIENTTAILKTIEAGDVAVSLVDTPDSWDEVLAAEPSAYVIPESQLPPSKEARIEALQVAYEIDMDKLNKAWLSAMIADGAGEAARQAIVKGQMDEINAQLDADIFAIIIEE